MLKHAFCFLARTVLRVFYRRLVVEGIENVPPVGPCLILPNHNNAVVDPLVVGAVLPRPVRFVAKATLWKNPVMAAILDLTDGIPIARAQDRAELVADKEDPDAMNESAFDELHRAFSRGECVGMFPEGVSHSSTKLARLKSGAALMALQYGEAHGFEASLPLVPVGLSWSEPGSFRSDVAVVIGEPVDPSEFYTLYRERGRRALVALTRKISAALEDVTLLGASARRRRRVERACALIESLNRTDPERHPLPREDGEELRGVMLRRRALDRAVELERENPARLTRLRRAIGRLEALERAAGIAPRTWGPLGRPRHSYSAGGAALEALLLIATLPATLAGALLWAPAYAVIHVLGGRASSYGKDDVASYKVYSAMAVSPVWMALLLVALPVLSHRLLSAWWPGLLTAVAAPLLGWWALRRIESGAELLGAGVSVFRKAAVIRALVRRKARAARLLREEILSTSPDGANS